jgi:hypothetical protein
MDTLSHPFVQLIRYRGASLRFHREDMTLPNTLRAIVISAPGGPGVLTVEARRPLAVPALMRC